MKRRVWLGVAAFVLGLAATLLVLRRLAPPLPVESSSSGACSRAGVRIAPQSVIAIYGEPERILADPGSFWATDPAYQLLGQSPWVRGGPVPPEGWVQAVEAVAQRGRRHQRAYTRSRELIAHADAFCSTALPVISALLPAGADLSSPVYLTALTDHACFAYRGNVVMDTGNHRPTQFFNVLGHELFHIGYFDVEPYQTEVWSDNYPTKRFLLTLQNDGLAVYVQQLLSESSYPAPLEVELLLLNNKLAVRYLTGRVNALLRQTDRLTADEAVRRAHRGINQRALYTVGAHMARTIDDRLGREALVRTVAEGPRSFVAAYNQVAQPGLRIIEVPAPAVMSPVQTLRDAALRADYEQVGVALATMSAAGPGEPDGAVFEHLRSAGLVLLRDEQPDLAIEVFELMAVRFPDHPDTHLHLAQIYRQVGRLDEAQAEHQRAVEIDPMIVAIATQ